MYIHTVDDCIYMCNSESIQRVRYVKCCKVRFLSCRWITLMLVVLRIHPWICLVPELTVSAEESFLPYHRGFTNCSRYFLGLLLLKWTGPAKAFGSILSPHSWTCGTLRKTQSADLERLALETFGSAFPSKIEANRKSCPTWSMPLASFTARRVIGLWCWRWGCPRRQLDPGIWRIWWCLWGSSM